MPYYRQLGDVPRKRHTLHERGGSVAFEELMGTHGFSGPSALLYHRRSPSAVRRIERVDEPPVYVHPNHPLRPHHFRTSELPGGAASDAVRGRHVLLANDDVELSFVSATESSPLYRNATGDELLYIHEGTATLESIFGTMTVGPGDYVVVPTSTTHRWVVRESVGFFIMAARGHVGIPARYLNPSGQMLEGAPFSERDQRSPGGEPLLEDGEDVPVFVRTRNGLTCHVHVTHPFDVIGWDGALYPWALNIHDFEPIVGRIHQPPPVHQTFAGPNFVVCSFVPRLFDFDPEAVKVPYHHSNVDSDEVLFYTGGDFMSRAGSGIGAGSMSLHPPGFVHGPQPGSRERSIDKDRTNELAVMIDTFRPLSLSDAALGISDPDYSSSWTR